MSIANRNWFITSGVFENNRRGGKQLPVIQRSELYSGANTCANTARSGIDDAPRPIISMRCCATSDGTRQARGAGYRTLSLPRRHSRSRPTAGMLITAPICMNRNDWFWLRFGQELNGGAAQSVGSVIRYQRELSPVSEAPQVFMVSDIFARPHFLDIRVQA